MRYRSQTRSSSGGAGAAFSPTFTAPRSPEVLAAEAEAGDNCQERSEVEPRCALAGCWRHGRPRTAIAALRDFRLDGRACDHPNRLVHSMPAPPSHIPAYHERAAMDAIRGNPNYYAGPATILTLLRKGWIEKKAGMGLQKYEITAAGEEALKAKMRTY